MSANANKRKITRDKIEIYAYGASKEIVCKKDEALYNNTIKQQNNSLFWWYYKK